MLLPESEHYMAPRMGVTQEIRLRDGSADLGLATSLGVDEFFVFPIVNFVWTFT